MTKRERIEKILALSSPLIKMETKQIFLDRAQWIMGFMSMEELSFLAEIASGLKENSIIYEIGSLCGRSSRAIADNSPNSCKIYCIDPWEFEIPTSDNKPIIVNNNTKEQFFSSLRDYIISGKVIPRVTTWQGFVPLEKADFIFIDGDHTYESARYDIWKAIKYIKSDGIIAGHDYQFDSVRKAISEYFSPKDIQIRETIWWTKKF